MVKHLTLNIKSHLKKNYLILVISILLCAILSAQSYASDEIPSVNKTNLVSHQTWEDDTIDCATLVNQQLNKTTHADNEEETIFYKCMMKKGYDFSSKIESN